MDEILEISMKVSPAVDDLSLTLYPPLSASDIETNSQSLINLCRKMLDSLKNVHFVESSDLEQWGQFLTKALDHNQSKLEMAITQLKLNAVEIK